MKGEGGGKLTVFLLLHQIFSCELIHICRYIINITIEGPSLPRFTMVGRQYDATIPPQVTHELSTDIMAVAKS